VDPNLCLALFEVESSCKGQQFRFGPSPGGTYYFPGGLHKDYLKRGWKIYEPYANTIYTIRALAFHLAKQGNLRAALMKYNTDRGIKFERYYQRIVALQSRNKNDNIFTKVR
jgi:hypothetical protein